MGYSYHSNDCRSHFDCFACTRLLQPSLLQVARGNKERNLIQNLVKYFEANDEQKCSW